MLGSRVIGPLLLALGVFSLPLLWVPDFGLASFLRGPLRGPSGKGSQPVVGLPFAEKSQAVFLGSVVFTSQSAKVRHLLFRCHLGSSAAKSCSTVLDWLVFALLSWVCQIVVRAVAVTVVAAVPLGRVVLAVAKMLATSHRRHAVCGNLSIRRERTTGAVGVNAVLPLRLRPSRRVLLAV